MDDLTMMQTSAEEEIGQTSSSALPTCRPENPDLV